MNIDINLLQEKLNKLKIKDVANFFNVSISVIRKRIKENNLVITKKSGNFEKELPKELILKIIELRNKKLTIVEIANLVNIGINKTRKILKENKVSTKRIK